MIDNLEKQSAAEIGRLIAKGRLDPGRGCGILLGPHRARPREPVIHSRHARAGSEGSGGEPHASSRGTGGRPARWRSHRLEGPCRHGGRAHHRRVGALRRVRRRKRTTRRSSRIWPRPAWWLWARPISRNSPSRRLDSIRISERREILAIRRRLASPEDPRQAPRSRSPAALRLARSAATPAVRSARRPASAASSGLRPARGGSTSRAYFRCHARSTRSARWRTRSRIAC